jgi:WD40 repeat protein
LQSKQQQPPAPMPNAILALAFSTEGRQLASSDEDGRLCVWDVPQAVARCVIVLTCTDCNISINFHAVMTRLRPPTSAGWKRGLSSLPPRPWWACWSCGARCRTRWQCGCCRMDDAP